MPPASVLAGPRRRRAGSRGGGVLRAELALLWLAAGALAVVGLLTVVAPSAFALPDLLDLSDAPALLGAAAVYALGHVLRITRLSVLIHHPGIRLRRVMQLHLFTTGLGVLLPFKLSELVRVREVGVLTGRWTTGLIAVWLERALDAAVLAVLVLVAVAGVPDALELLRPVLLVGTAFVLVTILLMTVVPANIRGLMLTLVRRPYGERSVSALRVMRGALSVLHEAPGLLRGRLPTLGLLSAGIWIAELAAVSIAIPELDFGISRLAAGMLALFSGLSVGVTPLMASSGDRLADALGTLGSTPDVDLYRACLVVPALVAGALAGFAYLRSRRTGR